jgi:hypothetical protein
MRGKKKQPDAIIKKFCANPSFTNFKLLPLDVRELTVSMSREALQKKKTNMMASMIIKYNILFHHSDWRRSLPIVDTQSGRTYDIVSKGKLLFRASKDRVVLEKDRATYFGPTIHIANLYMRDHKNGFLNIYQTTAELKLFRLDNLDNVNRLLRESYASSDKSLYKTIADMFVAGVSTKSQKLKTYIQSENPLQFKKLLRSSLTESDFRFANWLCANGFQGYSAGRITVSTESFPREFHGEIMLCDPTTALQLVMEVQMKQKQQSFEALQAIVHRAQTRIAV